MDMSRVYGRPRVINKSGQLVRWLPPSAGSFQLNVDGSVVTNPGRAGFGGLIRDDSGSWLTGFYGFISISSITHAELVALKVGLQVAWDQGIHVLECASDSKLIVQFIFNGVSPCHRYAAIIHDIKMALARDWIVTLRHTYREGNQSADFLAKQGARQEEDLVLLQTPPSGLHGILLADAQGVSFYR